MCIVLSLMHVHKGERGGGEGVSKIQALGLSSQPVEANAISSQTKKTLGPCLLLKKISCLLLE